MPIDQGVVDSVAASNFKFQSELAVQLMQQYLGNQVAHLNRVNVLAETYLAVAVKSAHQEDIKDAISNLKETSGNDLAQQLAALNATVASMQQAMKGAQSTPPETAVPAK